MPHIHSLDEAAESIVTKTRELVADTIAPHAVATDVEGRFPTESLAALADAGLYGLTVPVEFGGGGLGPSAFAAVVEEISKACASTAMIYVMHVSGTQAIVASSSCRRCTCRRNSCLAFILRTLKRPCFCPHRWRMKRATLMSS